MADNFQIRDFFNENVVNKLSDRLINAWPEFEKNKFTNYINPKLPKLTYSERSKLITDALEKFLPNDYPQAVKILLNAQIPPYDSDELVDSNDRFITVPITAYISNNGLNHFAISMHALYEMTKRMTSEWAIRIFLIEHQDKTLEVLKEWATDKNPHVRRLVSEGSRPFLPWGKRLNHFKNNPEITINLLELLKNDSSEYVRRSVANHLNDHAKNHPNLIVKTLRKWKKEHPGKNMEKLIKHATRTLVKNGHAGALELIGFKRGAKIEIDNFQSDKKVKIGNYLNFSFNILSTGNSTQKLVIDYLIYFQKADNSLKPKVFKLTTKEIGEGERISLAKKHSFKIITTRKYHPGKHKIGIQVNGEERATSEFVIY